MRLETPYGTEVQDDGEYCWDNNHVLESNGRNKRIIKKIVWAQGRREETGPTYGASGRLCGPEKTTLFLASFEHI
ncbi:hypothetical protein Tco_0609225 [Tanacetum coccineum]